jgi:phage terminase large subunit GpA-like protein
LHIANKLLRIALLVKLAIKATDDNDMYNRAFPGGNALFLFVGGVMSLFGLP